MHVERHAYGSFSGYTTLARSPGITAEDAQVLEGLMFGFGQTSDRKFGKSLRSFPAYFVRPMRGGRRVLTRLLEGDVDDAGRPTVMMLSAILSQRDWDSELYGDVLALLKHQPLWAWRSGEDLPAIDLPTPPPAVSISKRSAGRVAQLISQIEIAAAGQAPSLVVSADEFPAEDLRAVEMLIPRSARATFGSAYRSLSPQFPVTLNALAAEASPQRLTYRVDDSTASSTYAQHLLENGLADGKLPVGEALTYRGFGHAVRTPAPAATVTPVATLEVLTRRQPITATLLPIAAALIAGLSGGFAAGWYVRSRRANQPLAATTVMSTPAPTALPSPPASEPALATRSVVQSAASTQPIEQQPTKQASQPLGNPLPTSGPAKPEASIPPPKIAGDVPTPSPTSRETDRVREFEDIKKQWGKSLPQLKKILMNWSEEGEAKQLVAYLAECGQTTKPLSPDELIWFKNNEKILAPLQLLYVKCETAAAQIENFPKIKDDKEKIEVVNRLLTERDEIKGLQDKLADGLEVPKETFRISAVIKLDKDIEVKKKRFIK